MNLDLEDILIAWGRVYGKGREFMEDRSLTGNSSIARIIGKPKKKSTVGRNGINRRIMMGKAAGKYTKDGKRPAPIPTWACDPVSGKQTRSHKPNDDPRETPMLVVVQSAWLALHRISEQEATALRLHYQRRDLSREQRARELRLTVRAYRESVAKGRQFIQDRLAA